MQDRLVGRQIGRYRVAGLIGHGGMSAVYRAFDGSRGCIVALKIMPAALAAHPDLRDRFRRETESAARLNHPHIVVADDFGEVAGIPYLAMAYVPGGSLRDRLDHGRLLTRDLVRIGGEIASALAFAHANRIVHRDVKPANVLLGLDGRAYLADFGIARVIEATQSLSRSGKTLGTATYMAPEQVQSLPTTEKTDVYSLGALIYEAATGRPPFVSESVIGLLYRHVTVMPEPPSRHNPDLPESIDSLLLRCLAKDPHDRPTADEVARALAEEGGDHQAVSSTKPPEGVVSDEHSDTDATSLHGPSLSRVSAAHGSDPQSRSSRSASEGIRTSRVEVRLKGAARSFARIGLNGMARFRALLAKSRHS